MTDLQTELMRRSFEIFIRQNRRKSHLARLCVNEKVVKYASPMMQNRWEQWQQEHGWQADMLLLLRCPAAKEIRIELLRNWRVSILYLISHCHFNYRMFCRFYSCN